MPIGQHFGYPRTLPKGSPKRFIPNSRRKLYRAIQGQSSLRRYELDPQKPIRIVVDNGKVTLCGVVDNKMDKQIAGVQASGVPGVLSVDNKLVVASQK